MLGSMYKHDNRHFADAFWHYQPPDQLHTIALEGCVAHLEIDALAALIADRNLVLVTTGERDNLAVWTICPAISAGPRAVFLGMKLAGFTGEHAPAQCVAIRWRDIDGPAVTQAIRPDMTIGRRRRLCCRGNGRQNRKPEKRDGGDDCTGSHACITLMNFHLAQQLVGCTCPI